MIPSNPASTTTLTGNSHQQQIRRESLYHWHMISLYLDKWNLEHGRKPKCGAVNAKTN